MRTRIFPLVVVCLLCLFSVKAQNVKESESSIIFNANLAKVSFVVENPADDYDDKIELEILDAEDVVRAKTSQNFRIERGKKTYKLTMPTGNLLETAADGIDWFRLRYRVGGKTGIISLSQLVKDIFELRIAATERIFAGMEYQVRVRAVSPAANVPVKKVKIEGELEIDLREGSADDVDLSSNSETDSEGFAVLKFKIPSNVALDDVDLIVKGSKNGIVREVNEDLNTDENGGKIMLTTDKPLYQPGQDFKVRGLYFDANNTVVTNAELEFKILDEDDTVLFKEKVTTSAFGIAAVSWRIPDGAKLGSYRVEVDADKDLSEDSLYFKVSRYDLPNFAVKAKPDKTFYLPTDKQAEIAVTADYLFGKPVTKGKVRVVQESERRWNWRAQKYDVNEKDVFEGETDKDGKYVVKVDLSEEFTNLKNNEYSRFEDLHFSAYFTDPTTNRTEQRRFDVRISKEPIHVYLVGRRYALSPRMPITKYVSTFYADGTPVACEVQVSGKNYNDSDDKFKVLQRLKTNSYGAGKVEFERPKNLDSSDDLDLKIIARARDGKTGMHQEELEYYNDYNGLIIEAEKAIYKPGESIRANIVSSKKSGYVYVDVVKDWTAIATYLTKFENGKADLKIPYNPNFKGDLTLAAYDDNSDDYYGNEDSRDSFGIIFPTEENLKIEAKFEKAVYKPNEDAKINFSSLDGAGKPIETAFGVVIFDRAIEERARTDADFGGYFSRYSYFLGYGKSFGGTTLKDLNALDLGKPISNELQLVAEVMLADNYFYPRIHHSNFSPTQPKYTYEKTFKKQFAPIEDALKKQFEKTGESASSETTLKNILSRNNLNFDEIRDVWGNNYRAVFRVDKTQQILTWKSAGADKFFDTKDDFDVSSQSFAYFQPIGKAIDAAAENYHKQTGKYIRDRETLRAELAKQNIDLSNLKDRWNRDYRITFEVEGRNYDIRFYSYGENGYFQPSDWNKDDFDVWKTSQDYFYKTEQKISEIFARTVNAGKRAFPRNDDEFKQILLENDLDFSQIKDGYGKLVYLTYNKFSRYSDKTVIENGKEKITPVTEEVVNFNIQSEGANIYETRDNAVLSSFSGVVVEQSKETDYKKKDAKTISFAGNAGAIRGTVTDASGAVVPNATITITDESNSAKIYATTTDENGEFVIAILPPAKYSVRIDASGFKSFLYQNTEVRSQIAVEIKATMEAGGVSEVVSITADTSASGDIGSPYANGTGSLELSVNGTRTASQSVAFNGIDATNLSGGKLKENGQALVSQTEQNSTPRLREYFPETLLWNPEVITDKNGKAEVKFKLADNITTWKLYAIGSTKNGKVGVTEKEIQAFQPFFVDLEPPKFLTEGDEIHLPTQIRNYTDKKQKVSVTMAKSDWFSFLGNEKQNIEVASGASENAVFGFKAIASITGGKQKVTAIADSDSDAIEKPVTVRPNGQEIVRTESKLFTNSAAFDVNFPNNALPKTQKAELKIYPNLMAHVTESVEGLLQRPYGCGEQTISSTYPNLMILKFTRGETNTKKLALKYLQKGYERLVGYQVASGGFSYWGGKEEADIALTAYALRFLADAKSFIAVDEEAIKKAENWLISQQRTDGSFTKKYYWETTEDTSRTKMFTSYVARTLAKIQAETKDSANPQNAALDKALAYLKIQNARIDEPYALALYGLSLLDAGKGDEANAVAEILTKMAIPENNAVYWKLETNTPFYGWGTAGRVETTALVVQFLIKSKVESQKSKVEEIDNLIAKGTMFLLKNKDRYGVWYSTQTTINVLDAFLAALSGEAQDAPQNQQINITLNGANLQTITVSPDQIAPIIVDTNGKLTQNENALEITSSTNSAVMAQIVANHYIDWKDAEITGENTNVSRQLQLDYKCDKQNPQIMEEVNCAVKAERVGFKGYGMLLAEIGIPPGADVSRESLQSAMESDWSFSRYDILPDRIVIYMWSKPGGTNINFKFKPRYGINAQTPSSFVYDYYNEEAKATLAPLKFEVK